MTVATKKARDELMADSPPGDDLRVVDLDWSTVDGCVGSIQDTVETYLRDHIDMKTATFVVDAANKAANIRLKMGQSASDGKVGEILRGLLEVPAELLPEGNDAVDAEFKVLTANKSEGAI